MVTHRHQPEGSHATRIIRAIEEYIFFVLLLASRP